jgi:hypothetical protein
MGPRPAETADIGFVRRNRPSTLALSWSSHFKLHTSHFPLLPDWLRLYTVPQSTADNRLLALYGQGVTSRCCDKKNKTNRNPQSREKGNRAVGAGRVSQTRQIAFGVPPRACPILFGRAQRITLPVKRRFSTPVCCAQIQTCTEILTLRGCLKRPRPKAGGVGPQAVANPV